MSDRTELLALSVRESAELTARFFEGFDDGNRLATAPGIPNHAAWTLGHLALTMARVAQRLGGPAPSPHHFLQGADSGTADAFGTEQIAFGSTPSDSPDVWPLWPRCVTAFENATEALASTIASLDDEALHAETPWGSGSITNLRMILRMPVHNGNPAGQLIDLRRALGMGRVIG